MVHEIHIVTIDEDRMFATVNHVQSLGFEPVAISGVDPDTVTAPDMTPYNMGIMRRARKYTNGDIKAAMLRQEHYQDLYRREKVAIVRAMKRAVEVVGSGTIVQDDYRFPAIPEIDNQPLVVWSGDTLPGHYCPRAFTFNEEIGKLLVNAWSDERHNACDGWLSIIRKHKMEPTWR